VVGHNLQEEYTLRRYVRERVGPWWGYGWFNPKTALPEERRFDLLGEGEGLPGSIVFTSYATSQGVAETPWGRMEIHRQQPRRWEIWLEGHAVAEVEGNLYSPRIRASFHQGPELSFTGRRLGDIMWCDVDLGRVSIRFDGLRKGAPAKVADRRVPSWRDYRRLPKHLRPTSREGNYYRQWRIVLPREVPGKRSVLSSLATLVSFGQLGREVPLLE